VQIGALHDGLRIVREGVAPDERIVVAGIQKMHPASWWTPEERRIDAPAAPIRPCPREARDMNISRFFIDRPIFAAVLSIVTVILGSIAYVSLPVAQYPDVVPPTIVVRASYPARRRGHRDTVATPIEQEVNGVEDMLYMSSQSTTDGQMALTITFKLGTDLNQAQVLVQNRVAVAEPRLPEDVRRIGVTTVKSSPDLLMVVHLLSPQKRYDQLYIGNYGLIRVRDVLARIDGVGDVNLFGLREYSMRAWLDPERMQSRNLTTTDVLAALREQNVQVASGIIGQAPVPPGTKLQLPITTLGPPAHAGAVREHRPQARRRRPHHAHARHRPHRARRARLRRQQLPRQPAGGRDRRGAAAGVERARDVDCRPEDDGGAVEDVPRRASSTASSTTRRSSWSSRSTR
jgi:hypothetical protein